VRRVRHWPRADVTHLDPGAVRRTRQQQRGDQLTRRGRIDRDSAALDVPGAADRERRRPPAVVVDDDTDRA